VFKHTGLRRLDELPPIQGAETPSRVLVVDDDTDIREALTEALVDAGYSTTACGSATEALRVLAEENFDVVVTDVCMPNIDGIELCTRIAMNHDIPVIVMTAFGELSAAVGALRASAFDFITKPFGFEQLADAIERAISRRAPPSIQMLDATGGEVDFSELIGSSVAMDQLRAHLARICKADASVLITGESGTGKELIARALHKNSRRSKGPFVPISCAAFPAQLLESELFGHEKGAFTGAVESRPGLFLQANGGTLFLDEVGAMPFELQPALLRALQERVVRAVGSVREEPFDVRVIAATNQDLDQSLRDGTFRDALFFRLNVLEVRGPPLRERGEDVILLARHFLTKHAERHGGPPLILSDQTMSLLRAHTWPGNVRELQNCVEAAATLAQGGRVDPSDLPPLTREPLPSQGIPERGADASLENLQREQIETVLHAVGGNKAEAARVLGIDRVTLYRRIKRFSSARSAR
jgi:two-component system response regulator AtoC